MMRTSFLLLSVILLISSFQPLLSQDSIEPANIERPRLNFYFNFYGDAASTQKLESKYEPFFFFPISVPVSLNIERMTYLNEKSIITFRTGIGFDLRCGYEPWGPYYAGPYDEPELSPLFFLGKRLIFFPHHITWLTSPFNDKFVFIETGMSGSLAFNSQNDRNYVLFGTVGFRLLPLESKRMTFRAYYTIPVLNFQTEYRHIQGIGFSVGWSFVREVY